MANVTKNNVGIPRNLGGVPYGNVTALTFPLATTAGVWDDSDQATAIVAADVLRLGIIPKGTTLLDYILKISAVFTVASTGKIGFAYVDGVDSATVPQDDDYFCAATTLATAAILRQTNVAVTPVTLPKDAYLILTNAGATQATTGRLDIIVFGICDQAV
jgi:hypothetical protein